VTRIILRIIKDLTMTMLKDIFKQELYILNSFEDYVAQGGDIISFTDYFYTLNYQKEFKPLKETLIFTLCEEYALIGNYVKIFQILDFSFSNDEWSPSSIRTFMNKIKKSDLLHHIYKGVSVLYKKYKN
jgi:hypothetical protein